jgi:hypothetical protein
LPAFCGGRRTRGVGGRRCFERLLYRCALGLYLRRLLRLALFALL